MIITLRYRRHPVVGTAYFPIDDSSDRVQIVRRRITEFGESAPTERVTQQKYAVTYNNIWCKDIYGENIVIG